MSAPEPLSPARTRAEAVEGPRCPMEIPCERADPSLCWNSAWPGTCPCETCHQIRPDGPGKCPPASTSFLAPDAGCKTAGVAGPADGEEAKR